MIEANIARRAGLNNLRHHLAWRGLGPGGSDAVPRLRFMRTEGNLWLFEQLETLVCDTDDPEDVLKGGDDHPADGLRYGINHVYKPRKLPSKQAAYAGSAEQILKSINAFATVRGHRG